mgnify:CR=1 FL=1
MTQEASTLGGVTPKDARTTTLTNGMIIPADKVSGTDVYNGDGDHLGHIHDIMVDKVSGRVAFALMAFGGFLGIGERFHPLPWSILRYDEEKSGYLVQLDRKVLEDAPNYDFDEIVDWDDAGWRTSIYDHYGASGAWL